MSHPSHNICAHLDPTTKEAVDLAGIINFLRRSRIYHAISHRHDAYRSHQLDFWENATKEVEDGVSVLRSTVRGHAITISTTDIRRLLQLNEDDEYNMLTFNKFLVRGCFLRMGYTRDINQSVLNKAALSPQYKYLFHVLIHCLGPQKGGYDKGRETLQSAMVALVLNKPYNFSGMLFHHMVENLTRTTQGKFLMYPRFIQMIIDEKLPNLEKLLADKMKFNHMDDTTINRLKAYRGGIVPPTKRLIGHLINPAYVAPPDRRWRNDGSDSDDEVLAVAGDDSDGDDHDMPGAAGVSSSAATTAADTPVVHPGKAGERESEPTSSRASKGKESIVAGESVGVEDTDSDTVSDDSSFGKPEMVFDLRTKKMVPNVNPLKSSKSGEPQAV